jgi:hypothetical protein
MKTVVFYEVNENARTLPNLTDVEGDVFDAINNAGAVTERGLHKLLPGYPSPEIRAALSGLVGKGTIVRRTLRAHDTD